MHKHQFFTWTTHTAETTTLLEATRLQKLYTYMCNIVTEFYLYSIVYIYLINSRLDVTFSVRHHLRTIQTLSVTTKCSTIRETLPGIFGIKLYHHSDRIRSMMNFRLSLVTFEGFSQKL